MQKKRGVKKWTYWWLDGPSSPWVCHSVNCLWGLRFWQNNNADSHKTLTWNKSATSPVILCWFSILHRCGHTWTQCNTAPKLYEHNQRKNTNEETKNFQVFALPLYTRGWSKHSIFGQAAEVADSKHRAIVFPCRLIQLDAKPVTCRNVDTQKTKSIFHVPFAKYMCILTSPTRWHCLTSQFIKWLNISSDANRPF